MENLLVDVELGLPELIMDGLKIGDEALVSGALQDAHGANDGHA